MTDVSNRPETKTVKPTPADQFRDHDTNFESRWEALAGTGYLTPVEKFFVRNHTVTPHIDAKAWRLDIFGNAVERESELSLSDLAALPQQTQTNFLECAGNGRSFFDTVGGEPAEGTPWLLGAVGEAQWRGPRLADVLALAGVKPDALEVMPTGLDEMRVRRPLPIDVALADDTIVALEMNGEPLHPDHGYPARLVVPGWIGVANIKWIGSIEVSNSPLYSPWNTGTYVMIGPGYQPEPDRKGPLLERMPVKCALELAWPAVLGAGMQKVAGRAWSGEGAIERVEWSLDGETWKPAALLPDPNALGTWVRFSFEWDAAPGSHLLYARATDTTGKTQPAIVPYNELGYLYTGYVGHPVEVR